MERNIIQEIKDNGSDYIIKNKDFLIPTIKQQLEDHEVNLCSIVESLEPLLTHLSPSERALGTCFLVDILQSLSMSKINEKELKFLVTFFIDRLKDHHSVIPHVIVAFMTLIKQSYISSQDVKTMLVSLFREVHCQSQVMVDRRNFYNLIKYCILNKSEDVKQIESEFILGFISAMEGEKDPRNLVLLFSFIPNVTKLLKVNTFAEDFFEVIAAYFPIDFTPPSNDSWGVLPEDLVEGLRTCISSTDEFAEYCFPLLIEKINSALDSAKLDALLTLDSCCKAYSSRNVRKESLVLWSTVRRVALSDRAILGPATRALRSLVAACARESSEEADSALDRLADMAISECVPFLESSEQHLMVPNFEIILATCSESVVILKSVSLKVLPLLCEQYFSKTECVAKVTIIKALSKFLEKGHKFNIYNSDPLSSYKEVGLSVLLKVLTDSDHLNDDSMVEAALQGIQLILLSTKEPFVSNKEENIKLQEFISKETITEFGKACFSNLLNVENNNLRKEIIKAMVALGKVDSEVLMTTVVPPLLSYIKPEFVGPVGDTTKLVEVLEALAAVGSLEPCMRNCSTTMYNCARKSLMEQRYDTAKLYLDALKQVVLKCDSSAALLCFLTKEWPCVSQCQSVTIETILCNEHLRGPEAEMSPQTEDLYISLGYVRDICRHLGYRKTDILNECESHFLLGGKNTGSVLEGDLERENCEFLKDPQASIWTVYILVCMLPTNASSRVLARLRNWALTAKTSRLRREAAIGVVTHILCIDHDEISHLVADLEKNEMSDSALRESCDGTAVLLLAWVTKGLLMRGHSSYLDFIGKLEKLLLKDSLGEITVDAFSLLLHDEETLKPVEKWSKNVRFLYKQRAFDGIVTSLLVQHDALSGASDYRGKARTLRAVLALLPCVPNAVLNARVEKLVPLLCEGVSLSEASASAARSLSEVLRRRSGMATAATDAALIANAPKLVSALIVLTSATTMDARVKSLECLEALADLPASILVPLKQEVVTGLKIALDDRKRVVRQAATNARCAWVLL